MAVKNAVRFAKNNTLFSKFILRYSIMANKKECIPT